LELRQAGGSDDASTQYLGAAIFGLTGHAQAAEFLHGLSADVAQWICGRVAERPAMPIDPAGHPHGTEEVVLRGHLP